jgi:hypothetical protein
MMHHKISPPHRPAQREWPFPSSLKLYVRTGVIRGLKSVTQATNGSREATQAQQFTRIMKH